METIDAIRIKLTGTARELIGACLFLASERSGCLISATIDVDGDHHIH